MSVNIEGNVGQTSVASGWYQNGRAVYFTKLTVTPDDERAWFKMHPQWSKSNKYAELEVWIFI